MITRRSALAMLAALPLATQAHAGKGGPAWWLGEVVAKPGRRTITATRFGSRQVTAKLATKVTPKSVELTSSNNANTQFTMWVVFAKQPDQDVFLSADGGWWQSDSFGHDSTGSQASFVFDRATAQRLAKVFKIPLSERTKLDDGLQATWSIPATASALATDPIAVKLRVKNAGTTTLGFVVGGRQRGPRDNRFTFTITRNGTPVAITDAPDFGGISFSKKLQPGDDHELTVDLRSWAPLDAPGHYAVDVTYEGELTKDGVMPTTATDRKHLWDVSLKVQGGILVR